MTTQSFKHRIFRGFIRMLEGGLTAVSQDLYFKAIAGLFDELNLRYRVETKKGPLFIHCDSETVRIRARAMLSREPDTLAWIETFSPDEVLWDIGANIGVFTLYAARVAGARVVAFDPLPMNHAGLTRNLYINGLTDKVNAFCAAVSDRTEIARLRVPAEANTPGGAGGVFNDEKDNFGKAVAAVYELGALGFGIDDFLDKFDIPFPNHIKLDIDGIQGRVIAGARTTLRDARLKTAMIELQPMPKQTDFILKEMAAAGFTLDKTVASVAGEIVDINTGVTNNFFVRT
jgi:FkbM family methyltransferase